MMMYGKESLHSFPRDAGLRGQHRISEGLHLTFLLAKQIAAYQRRSSVHAEDVSVLKLDQLVFIPRTARRNIRRLGAILRLFIMFEVFHYCTPLDVETVPFIAQTRYKGFPHNCQGIDMILFVPVMRIMMPCPYLQERGERTTCGVNRDSNTLSRAPDSKQFLKILKAPSTTTVLFDKRASELLDSMTVQVFVIL
jgi:hypothetical protein